MPDEKKLHAILSPSNADRWMTCLGSVALTKDLPDIESEYAAEGTDYHELAAVCLEEDTNAKDYVGRPLLSGAIVTDENANYTQVYVDAVRAYATHGTLLVEEKVPLEHLTGEVDAEGTADAVVLGTDGELIVCDLKFGRGVPVPVENNRQLMLYALGVLEKHGLIADYEKVRLVICQPRNGGTQEWLVPVKDLQIFADEVRIIARKITTSLDPLSLNPSEKACQFCKAKATCPALTDLVKKVSAEGFDDLESVPVVSTSPTIRARAEKIGDAMGFVGLVELWCKAVRSAAEVELLAGRPVNGYKLVQGKRGNRAWEDAGVVEELFKKQFRMSYSEMYDLSLISPTTAEKVLKDKPVRWKKVLPLITQKEGKPSVAPESDPRPALVVDKPEDGFNEVETADDLL